MVASPPSPPSAGAPAEDPSIDMPQQMSNLAEDALLCPTCTATGSVCAEHTLVDTSHVYCAARAPHRIYLKVGGDKGGGSFKLGLVNLHTGPANE
jgi:hypothetical protein